jgi:hypothetical protein
MLFLFGWHNWKGESGRRYRFNITLTTKALPDEAGIYMFVKRRFVFFLIPLYIGKASNFRSRVIGHERWWEAWWKRGATERHILKVRSAKKRPQIEEDLIRRHNPPMNRILVPKNKDDAPIDTELRKWWHVRRWFNSMLPWT